MKIACNKLYTLAKNFAKLAFLAGFSKGMIVILTTGSSINVAA